MGYDASGIYHLWNRYRVIHHKDVIFDKRLTQSLNTTSPLSSNAIIPSANSLLPVVQTPISIDLLDEALENDRGNGFDHSHLPINPFEANTNFSVLTLLASTSDPTPYPTNYSITLVLNTLPAHNIRSQISTKSPPGCKHIAWLTIAYQVGYDAGIPDPLFYSKAMSRSNSAQ